jgi:hypothetical protein
LPGKILFIEDGVALKKSITSESTNQPIEINIQLHIFEDKRNKQV